MFHIPGRDALMVRGVERPLDYYASPRPGEPSPFHREAAAAAGPESFDAALARFLEDFLSDAPAVRVFTSGSTGRPKAFAAQKTRMLASARATVSFLRLQEDDENLLAMPLDYIAGKMVVVRSLACGLDLVPTPPAANPFAALGRPVDFACVTPMQAAKALGNPATAKMLLACRRVIIGGGAVDDELLAALQSAEGEVYSSYGMTETLSHIALRRLNGPEAEAAYRPLPGVALSISPKGTLVICAPAVADGALVTNDAAALEGDGSFRIIGRLDNVINTGAVKVQIETVEAKLKGIIKKPFAISSRPSRTFGEEVVLVIAGAPEDVDWDAMKQALSRFEKPHAVAYVGAIPLRATQKPDRPAIRTLAAQAQDAPAFFTSASSAGCAPQASSAAAV